MSTSWLMTLLFLDGRSIVFLCNVYVEPIYADWVDASFVLVLTHIGALGFSVHASKHVWSGECYKCSVVDAGNQSHPQQYRCGGFCCHFNLGDALWQHPSLRQFLQFPESSNNLQLLHCQSQRCGYFGCFGGYAVLVYCPTERYSIPVFLHKRTSFVLELHGHFLRYSFHNEPHGRECGSNACDRNSL